MCYTFVPTKAAEYLDEGEPVPVEGVLVGYKSVIIWKGELHGILQLVEPRHHHPTRCVQTDLGHGFHVAETPTQASLAFGECWDVGAACSDAKLTERLRLAGLIGTNTNAHSALVRVLIPRAAVRPDGHVTHIYIIPPNEHETREDIEKVAAVHRGLCEIAEQRETVLVEEG